MNVTETIRTFLEFFGDRGHQMVLGSSLVAPHGDPVLFTPILRAGGWPACSAACGPPIWTRLAMTGT